MAVAATKVFLEGLRVLLDEIEDRLFRGIALAKAGGALLGIARAEQPLEDRTGIRLGRHRLSFRAPREIKLIGAGVAGVAVAGIARAVGAEF